MEQNLGIPEQNIVPLKEILEVGLYDENLKGEKINCKDWDENQVLNFIETMPKDHDLYLPVGFIETIEKDPYQLYCDTDSVVGTSKIWIGNEQYNHSNPEIEKLWNDLNSVEVESQNNGKECKNILDLDIFTPTINKPINKPIQKRIKKIIRHKIEKKLYRIKTGNNEVIITEDHSLVVLRNGELFGITIKELKDGDKLLEIQNPTLL